MRTLLILLLLGAAQSISAQMQTLSFRLKVGETYQQSIEAKSTIKQNYDGQKINLDMNMEGKLMFEVAAKKDSVYEMNVYYDRLAWGIRNGDRTIIFTSDKQDETDILSKLLAALTGKRFTVSMTQTGKITSIGGLDSIYYNLFAGIPTELTEDQKAQALEQLTQSFGEDAFRGNFEMLTAIYPNDPVEKNNTWRVETNLSSGFKAKQSVEFKFKKVDDGTLEIAGEGKVIPVDADQYTIIRGMETRQNLLGTIQYQLKTDAHTGWIIQGKIRQKLSGNMVIKPNEELPDGFTVPISMESESNYTN